PHVLSVIASGKESSSSNWSNYGKEKDITAPGEAIYSTLPSRLTKYSATTGANKGKEYDTEKYDFMDGTSMAAPIVSSVAAILYSLGPASTLTRIENAICKTAKDIGPKGKDAFTGNGLIDAGKATQFIIAPLTPTGYKVQLSTSSKTSSVNYRTAKLSWNKMSRATGYRIAYKTIDAKSYTYKDVSASTDTVKLKLSAGKKYKFKVRGYREIGGVSNYSPYTAIKTLTTLKAPVLNKVIRTSAGHNKLKWSNIDGESGYQVCKRKGKKGKWFTVKWKKAGYVAFTDKKINKKYTYYYKVRAYKNVTVNGVTKKVYGPWSKVRSR
ncbi:MAG: S8 family serine peptidase, partial [Firmicutes bacterium]|nr:S8 family serine peptidase [Bacillota bacterium]